MPRDHPNLVWACRYGSACRCSGRSIRPVPTPSTSGHSDGGDNTIQSLSRNQSLLRYRIFERRDHVSRQFAPQTQRIGGDIVFALSLVAVPSAFAAGIVEKLGDVEATVYAPSVVWQATNAHVIVKLENKGSAPVNCRGISSRFPRARRASSTTGSTRARRRPRPKDRDRSLQGHRPRQDRVPRLHLLRPQGQRPVGQYTGQLTLKVGTPPRPSRGHSMSARVTSSRLRPTQSFTQLYVISAGMLVFWFVYFKGFIKKNFKLFAGEQPQ